jgi:hypothetical protein
MEVVEKPHCQWRATAHQAPISNSCSKTASLLLSGGGKSTILDEDYRKAGKIDTTSFCTDFSLAENEILATIIQTLGQGCVPHSNYNGIRAELYKLNVSLIGGNKVPHY